MLQFSSSYWKQHIARDDWQQPASKHHVFTVFTYNKQDNLTPCPASSLCTRCYSLWISLTYRFYSGSKHVIARFLPPCEICVNVIVPNDTQRQKKKWHYQTHTMMMYCIMPGEISYGKYDRPDTFLFSHYHTGRRTHQLPCCSAIWQGVWWYFLKWYICF